MITKETLKDAINYLKQGDEMEELVSHLEYILNDPNNKTDSVWLIDRKGYWAVQVWSEEDIINVLNENDLPCTDENINYVRQYSRLALEDCTNGWMIINDAVFNLRESLRRNRSYHIGY